MEKDKRIEISEENELSILAIVLYGLLFYKSMSERREFSQEYKDYLKKTYTNRELMTLQKVLDWSINHPTKDFVSFFPWLKNIKVDDTIFSCLRIRTKKSVNRYINEYLSKIHENYKSFFETLN